MTFARKNVRILHYVCAKNIFFRDFLAGGGATPSPMPLAGPQASHQLNPALYVHVWDMLPFLRMLLLLPTFGQSTLAITSSNLPTIVPASNTDTRAEEPRA